MLRSHSHRSPQMRRFTPDKITRGHEGGCAGAGLRVASIGEVQRGDSSLCKETSLISRRRDAVQAADFFAQCLCEERVLQQLQSASAT